VPFADIAANTPKHLIPAIEELLPPAAHKQVKMTDACALLQPRNKDYNGQGLARPTLYMDFHSPDFVPRFNEHFGEHVAGFFGKVKTKAMKKQKKMEEEAAAADGNDGETGLQAALKSDMFKNITDPNERVERMLAAGLL
jgi:hypothetical protein